MRSCLLFVLLTSVVSQASPSAQAPQAQQSVPRVVRFSGTAVDANGRPMAGTVSMVFSLYDVERDGTPLWVQTINVGLDAQGRYAVLLGTEGDGLPPSAFAENAARWVGVQPAGQPEMPRVPLISVPYALKAADAETLGGKPVTAFKLAETASGGTSALKTTERPADRDGPQAQVINDNLEVDFTSGIGLRLNGPSNHLVFQDSSEAGAAGWWYMYRQGADGKLRFYHNGADRAVFGPEGYLGLGTYSPVGPLHINAASNHITLQDSAEAGAGYWYLYRTGADGKLKFYRNGDRMVLDGAGRMGLGTTSPIGQLHIAAPANHLAFQDTSEAGANYWYQYAQGGDGKLHFWKNGFDRLVLGPSGNVSIGAVSPVATRLDVAQTTSSNTFADMTRFVNSDVNSVGAAVRGETATQYGNAGAAGVAGYATGTGGYAGFFYSTNAAGNGTTVVIGTNGDGEALNVAASNSLYTTEILQSGSGGAARIYTGASGGTGSALVTANFNASNASDVIFAEDYGTGAVIKANHRGTSGNIAVFQSSGANVARIDKTGKGFFNGGTQTGGADVAESFAVDGDATVYEPGDVLEISEHARQMRRSSSAYSTRIAGVYATKPGVLLSDLDMEADASGRVPLGVIGVIPTKVSAENGAIRAGDLLVSAATPGHAMKAGANPPVGSVLGKALEDFSNARAGRILVLVNVR